MAPSLISMQQASMVFGGHRVLDQISLEIPRGQTICVIGESGCGKTVLLKLLIGLLTPTSGKILFDGKCFADIGERELTRERLRFGFLFQGGALFDSMSVYENVAFGMRQQRKAEKEIRDVVRSRLLEVGLPATVEPKKPAELSGGMRKRVALARALALEPEVMLYDEPTTGLDPIMIDVINQLILQTRQAHPVTSIVVTHEMKTVETVADRVVMFYPLSRLQPGQGQVLFDGSIEMLRASSDPRVQQFIRGEGRDRLKELANA